MATAEAPTVPFPTAIERFPEVRQSYLSQFDRCALSTAMGLEWEEGWSTHEQARGQIAHRVFARCLAIMYEESDFATGHIERSILPEIAVAQLREELRQADRDWRDVVNLPMDQVKDLRWVVVKWANDNLFDIQDLVDVEQRLKAKVSYPNPHGGVVERIITGQLDALFISGAEADAAVVLDWKDTWGMPGPQELSFGGYFQQRLYAFLIFANYPTVESVTLDERYVRFSDKDDVEAGSRKATLWREDLEELHAEFSALIERFDRAVEHGDVPWGKTAKDLVKRMRAESDTKKKRDLRVEYENTVGLWTPSPGQHCGYCPRPTACPIFPTARGAGRITNAQDAERVAGETIVADAAAKKGKDALKVWGDKNGLIYVKDSKGVRAWGHQPQKRTVTPKPAEVAAEVKLAEVEGREPDIEGLWKTTVGTRFGLHQPKPPTDDGSPDQETSLMQAMEESVRIAQEKKAAEDAS